MLKTIQGKLKFTIFRLKYNFARGKSNAVDMQQFQNYKIHLMQKYAKKYQYSSLFKHEDILYQEQIYGNKSDICGITQNNQYSAEFVLQVIGLNKPKHLILGGLNDTEARFQFDQAPKRFGDQPILQASKLFCKSSILTMIQQKNKQDIDFFYDRKSKLIYTINHVDKRIEVNNYVVGAHNVILSDQCKVSYGKPSSIYIYEDLMLSMSLQKLQQIFQRTVKKVKQNNQNSILNGGGFIVEQIKNYAMNEQPQLYSKQITYTTAYLNRVTKIGNNNLLLIPNVFVKRIAQNCHHIDFPPQKVYRSFLQDKNSQNYIKLQNILSQNSPYQILKKFALLGFLKGFALQYQMHRGKHIFQNSIFKKLFQGMSLQQIINIYLPLKKHYRQRIHQIQRLRVKNNLIHEQQQEFMSIQNQWKQLQQRKQNFPYDFQVKNLATQQQDAQKLDHLKKKIEEIVQYECDDYEKQLLNMFNKGGISKQGIILYTKLIGKANVSLRDRVKLPIFHYGAFRGFFKEYYRDYLLYDEGKKFREKNKEKIQRIEAKFQKAIKQVSDPLIAKKYISGQMGPVKQVNFDASGNLESSVNQEDINLLRQMMEKMDKDMADQVLKDIQEAQKNLKSNSKNQEFNSL